MFCFDGEYSVAVIDNITNKVITGEKSLEKDDADIVYNNYCNG